jgi:hypothetical protein
MSGENVEFVLEGFRLAEANDLEAIAARTHPEVRGSAVRGWPEPGPFVGRDAALAETKRLIEWGENRFTDFDVVADEGDWVVVVPMARTRRRKRHRDPLRRGERRSGERRPGHRVAQPLEPRRGPRSCRAFGVGDVAGERRDR